MARVLVQATSFFGALLVLTAYFSSSRGSMRVDGPRYAVLNMIGGAALTGAALARSSWGFVLLEGAWTLIAVAALVRIRRSG